jgi:hypothetical protein
VGNPNFDLETENPFAVWSLRGRIDRACMPKWCYGMQARQSHLKKRDCFGSLAMTISKSEFGGKVLIVWRKGM